MMRRIAFGLLPVMVLAGCSGGPSGSAGPSGSSGVTVSSAPSSAAVAPVSAGVNAVQDGPCPYLDAQVVADLNGQKVLRTAVDPSFDPVACQFWSYGDAPQLTVLVRHMGSVDDARAVVDHYAPIGSTSPASSPAGWDGGRGPVDGGAVYAVSKDDTAVVITTNQAQSVKAELVAEEVIRNLGL